MALAAAPTTGMLRAAGRRRPRAVWGIAVGVCLAHAIAWMAWSRAPASPRAGPAASAVQVRLLAPPAKGVTRPPDGRPGPRPRPVDGGEAPSPAGPGPHAPAWRAEAFEPAEALDTAPVPLTDWRLDEALLQQQGRARLTVALWVAADGRIAQWRLLRAEPAGNWAAQALVRLSDTPMQPGRRQGQARAARLVIEIASDDEAYR